MTRAVVFIALLLVALRNIENVDSVTIFIYPLRKEKAFFSDVKPIWTNPRNSLNLLDNSRNSMIFQESQSLQQERSRRIILPQQEEYSPWGGK